MIRQTSLDAYRIITESRALSAARLAVYRYLFEHGPLTRNEIDKGLAQGRPNPTYSRRLAEMERMAVLQRVGERVCSITGFRAELWDVTDKLPQKETSRVVRRKRESLLAQLWKEIETGGVDIDPSFVERWQGRLKLGNEASP